MATIASRLKNDGTLLLNGDFDEVTYSGNTNFANKSTANTIYTTGEFDEVTFSTTAPVIKNLVHDTQNITTLTWGGFGVTYTSNSTIAPDGSNTASRLLLSGNTSYAAQTNIPITGGATYTFSFWVKSVSGSTGTWGINWYSGSHHRTTVPITGEWVRQSITFTPDVGVAQINVYVADNRESLANILDAHVWGAQLEQSSSATIYQPILAANTLLTGLPARKIANGGGYYVSGAYDEFTGAPIVDSSLMVWLDAGQQSSYAGSGNTWINLNTSAANSTLVGSPVYDTRGWFTFDGTTTQYANTGLPANTTFNADSEYTMACWIKFNNFKSTSTVGTMVGAFDYAGYGLIYSANPTSYRTGVYMRTTASTTQVLSPTISLNTWYYVTGTYSKVANSHILYMNGVSSNNAPASSGTLSTNLDNNQISIGYGSGGDGTPGGSFPGLPIDASISQVMIYNRALTADEVAQNFNALRRRYGI